MGKAHAIKLPTELEPPAIPGVDWDEIDRGFREQFERDHPAASEEERFINAVNEGIEDMKAGRMIPLEEVRRRMEQKFGIRR